MSNIEVRHIERTGLDENAFVKVVKKYAKSLNHNILIVFDLRIKDYGVHYWDGVKKLHIIRISPTKCKFDYSDGNEIRIGPVAEKYKIISAIIHELRHAQQKEELGYKFYSEHYGNVKEITNPSVSEWYSKCERDARIYEDTHTTRAVEYYNFCCKE